MHICGNHTCNWL